MKAQDIILQLMENIPKYVDSFSDYVEADSLSISGDIVTVNKTAHGFDTNDILVVTDGAFLNPISNIDDSNPAQIIFTTTTRHDLTYLWQGRIYLQSATDPSIDGWYTPTAVDNNTTFQLESFPDTGLTDVILKEFREVGINGLFQVTVIDPDSFSYQVPVNPLTTLAISNDAKLHTNIRISGASTIERCVDAYEKQLPDDFWGFVILDDNAISKDRYARSDADSEQGNLNQWNGQYLSPFSFYVFIPVEEITGRKARDEVEDIRPAIFKSLLGESFDTGFSTDAVSVVSPTGDGAHGYKKAYYIHNFDFMQVAQISNEDIEYNNPTSAWQNLEFDNLNISNDNGNNDLETEIIMDEKQEN